MEHKISVSQDKSIKIVEAINGREDKPFDFWRVLFEGAIAGGVTGVVETALYPIDTIKTRLQAGSSWWWENYFERTLFWLGRKSCWCLLPPQTRHLLLVVAMLLPLAPLQFRESFWNLEMLYDMAQQSLKDMVAENAIFVGVYELTKQKLLKSFPDNLSALAHLQRMQTGKFSSAPDAIRLIVAKEGFKGLYDGCEHPPSVKRYGSFLLRDLPFDAIQFCIYEQLQVGYKLAARRDLKDPENAIIVAFAGAITGAITTPLDVIKTRLMLQVSANQYNGIIDCVRTIIIREEGTPALLKGIGPRVLWIGIGGLIFFRVLERTKKITAQRRPLGQNSTSFKSD